MAKSMEKILGKTLFGAPSNAALAVTWTVAVSALASCQPEAELSFCEQILTVAEAPGGRDELTELFGEVRQQIYPDLANLHVNLGPAPIDGAFFRPTQYFTPDPGHHPRALHSGQEALQLLGKYRKREPLSWGTESSWNPS